MSPYQIESVEPIDAGAAGGGAHHNCKARAWFFGHGLHFVHQRLLRLLNNVSTADLQIGLQINRQTPGDAVGVSLSKSWTQEATGAETIKVPIVTGGNGGIDIASLEYRAERDARVVIDDLFHPEANEELEKEISAYGGSSYGLQADVEKPDDLQPLADATLAKYGRLDVMVSNAGIGTSPSILSVTMGPSH